MDTAVEMNLEEFLVGKSEQDQITVIGAINAMHEKYGEDYFLHNFDPKEFVLLLEPDLGKLFIKWIKGYYYELKAQKEAAAQKIAQSKDEVGYKKPPKHSQFKKGQSGNPSGKKKGGEHMLNKVHKNLIKKVKTKDGKTTTLADIASETMAKLIAQGKYEPARDMLRVMQECGLLTSV